MKRHFLFAAALTIASACAFAQAPNTAPMKITLAGGSVGGAWSAVGNAIGETLRHDYPGTSFTYEPGREQSNILLVSQGRVQLGIAHAQMVNRAKKGGEPFKEPVTNIRAIALVDPLAALQVFVRTGLGIDNLEQVAQQKKPVRIAVNQRGTMMAIAAEELLDAYGVSVKNIESWGGKVHYVSFNEGLDMMKNKQADIIINLLAYPSSQINTATREMPLLMEGIRPDVITKLDQTLGTSPQTVPGNTYEFQPKELQTVTASVVVFASASMSDDDANKIASAMINNMESLKQSHAMMRKLDPAALARVAPLVLHPGAEKAYRAAGALK